MDRFEQPRVSATLRSDSGEVPHVTSSDSACRRRLAYQRPCCFRRVGSALLAASIPGSSPNDARMGMVSTPLACDCADLPPAPATTRTAWSGPFCLLGAGLKRPWPSVSFWRRGEPDGCRHCGASAQQGQARSGVKPAEPRPAGCSRSLAAADPRGCREFAQSLSSRGGDRHADVALHG